MVSVYRRIVASSGLNEISLVHLVSELERDLFPFALPASVSVQTDEITNRPESNMEQHPPAAGDISISVSNISDSYRRREALTILKLRVGPHFHSLTLRDRFDLWIELKEDLCSLHGPGRNVLDKIHESLLSELSKIEQKALKAEMDTDLVRIALKNYLDYTYDPIPPTLRSTIESQLIDSTKPGSRDSNRKAARPKDVPGGRRFSVRRSLLLGLAVLVVAASAQLLYEFGQPKAPSRDIISLSVSTASSLVPDFRTSNLEQAERFILDRFGVRLQIPVISETRLLGVRVQLFHGDLEVPVLLYRDEKEELEFPVYAYTYAFLQSNRRRVELAENLLLRIEEATHFGVEFYSGGSALVWRNRDDIFAAVITVDPGQMKERIAIL